MFAYCGNNPVINYDPAGRFYRSAGASIRSVYVESPGELGTELLQLQREAENYSAEFVELLTQGQHQIHAVAHSLVAAHLHVEQALAEHQRAQDILVGEYVAYRFSTPELAIESVKIISWTCAGIALFAKNVKLAVGFTKVAWALEGLEFVIK